MPDEKKLLIVHHAASATAALATELGKLGHIAISSALNGESALAHAETQTVHLALIAFRLEGALNGTATALNLEKRFGIPSVFLVSLADRVELEKTLALPAFAYVLEPYGARELQMAIAATLAQNDAKRKAAGLARWWTESLVGAEEGIIGADANGRINLMNSTAEVLTGWLRREALGRSLAEVFRVVSENGRKSAGNIFEEAKAAKIVVHLEADRSLVRRNATEVSIQHGAAFIEESGGVAVIFRNRAGNKFFEDERFALEAKMLEAQRLESLGLLAGGIAHDFNNMLTAVIASVSLARLRLPENTPANDQLDTVESASMRAAELCRQMLAFSGRGKLGEQSVKMNLIVEEALKLMRPAFKSTVSIKWVPGQQLPAVLGDPVQLRQAIINLLRNAVEAVGERIGTINVNTHTALIDQPKLTPFLFGETALPGEFVVIEISDSGMGMSADVLERIFDPFFTTKFTGRGLGLAAVTGILRGHRGALRVESGTGQGTTMRLFFPSEPKPLVAPPPEKVAPATAPEPVASVLVADDDEAIRAFAKWVVERSGLRAVMARDGDQAVVEFKKDPNGFALVLLDLTMPRMNGAQVLAAIRKVNREVPIVFMTGYGEDAVTDEERAEVTAFLQKPFNPDALRAVLQRYAGLAKVAK